MAIEESTTDDGERSHEEDEPSRKALSNSKVITELWCQGNGDDGMCAEGEVVIHGNHSMKDVETGKEVDMSGVDPYRPSTASTFASSTATFSPRQSKDETQILILQSSPGCLSCLGPWRCRIICFLVVYLIFSTTLASYLMTKVVNIPILKLQVSRLTGQVVQLGSQVDQLQVQVYDFGTEVDRLSTEVDLFTTQNDQFSSQNAALTQSNAQYSLLNSELEVDIGQIAQLNKQLNATNGKYMTINDALGHGNAVYSQLNKNLSTSVTKLSLDIDRLGALRENLTATLVMYKDLSHEMESKVSDVDKRNAILNQTVKGLVDTISELQVANEYHGGLTANLTLVLSFLQDAANNAGQSFESTVASLAGEITSNIQLAIGRTEDVMKSLIISWRCVLGDQFVAPWVDNTRISIGSVDYPNVLTFLNQQLFSEICGGMSDFETYLASSFASLANQSDITLSQLSSGVSLYTRGLLAYYFHGGGASGGGISQQEWYNANFNCANLPENRKFIWSAQG